MNSWQKPSVFNTVSQCPVESRVKSDEEQEGCSSSFTSSACGFPQNHTISILLASRATSEFYTRHLIGQQPTISTLFKILTRLSRMLKNNTCQLVKIKTGEQLHKTESSRSCEWKNKTEILIRTSAERIIHPPSLEKINQQKPAAPPEILLILWHMCSTCVLQYKRNVLFVPPHESSGAAITYISTRFRGS